MPDNDTSELAAAVQELSARASLLVREEIALAKAEMTEKARKLAVGAAVGAIAGIFAVLGLIYLLHAFSWLLWRLIDPGSTNYWIGFAIVAVALFVFGAVGALLAYRAIRKGVPPAPTMAIEEGRLIRETVQTSRPATPVGPAATVPSPTTTEDPR
jgi:uncharacterized membrane protein YqjE